MVIDRPWEDTEVDANASQSVSAVTSAAAVRCWWSFSIKFTYLRIWRWHSRCVNLFASWQVSCSLDDDVSLTTVTLLLLIRWWCNWWSMKVA